MWRKWQQIFCQTWRNEDWRFIQNYHFWRLKKVNLKCEDPCVSFGYLDSQLITKFSYAESSFDSRHIFNKIQINNKNLMKNHSCFTWDIYKLQYSFQAQQIIVKIKVFMNNIYFKKVMIRTDKDNGQQESNLVNYFLVRIPTHLVKYPIYSRDNCGIPLF